MTRCRSTWSRNAPTSGRAHHDDLAAEGQHREAEHAGRVGERREREVDRAALERVAHQRDRRHRLEVGAGEHHALGPARSCRRCRRSSRGRRPAAAIARSVGAAREELVPGQRALDRRRPGRPGWSGRAGRRGSARPAPANDAWKTSALQPNRSSSSRFSAASLRGLIGHQTAPARLIPKTQVKATGSLADRIATVSPGRDALAGQRRGDAAAQLLHLGVLRVTRRRWSGRARPRPRDAPLSR